MKKRLISLLLAVVMTVALLPVTALADDVPPMPVEFTVSANKEAGLNGDVRIGFTETDGSYSGTLYLPGGVNIGGLTLSWDEGVSVEADGTAYESGTAPVPEAGESLTYAVTAGGSRADYTIQTLQGSADVEGMFLTIDESMGTIEAMNGDSEHETQCYGSAAFDGKDDYFISMKGRGNATWLQDKKPYNITFYKKADYESKKKVSLIPGVESKKWSLLANSVDNSKLRNKVGYDLANEMGIGLASRYVDLWMNGRYLGNYLITPKSDYQVSDDGFILELDNYKEPEGGDPQFTLKGLTETTASRDRYNRFTVKATGDDLALDTDGIHSWMQQAWNAIEQYNSEDYLAYIDLDSWAKMYLLNELYKNYDIIAGSILMHRDGTADTDKLIAGPIWDLDNAIGRVNVCPHNGVSTDIQRSADSWYIDSVGMNKFQSRYAYVCWLQELGKHESFIQRVYELYNENKDVLESMYDNIDTQAEVLNDSARMDGEAWESAFSDANDYIPEKVTYGSGAYAISYVQTSAWNDAVTNLKTFVSARLRFLSDKLTVAAPEAGFISGPISISEDDALTLTADTAADGYQWQSSDDGGATWANIVGATASTYSSDATTDMNGLSFRCVAKNIGATINTTRVAKAAIDAFTVLMPVTLTVTAHEHSYQAEVIAPTCTEGGYTVYACRCGDSYTDADTDALGHDYADGRCTRCQERDPDCVPPCISKKSVSLTADQLLFTLSGQEQGVFTFARSGSGWTIRGGDGKYLSLADQALAYSDTPFVWTYSYSRFQTTVTTTTGGWNYFGWTIGGRTTTTTYYLCYTGGKLAVSTGTSGANTGFMKLVERDAHSFGAYTTKDGVHSRTCTVCGEVESAECQYGDDHKCIACGAFDPAAVSITVNVSCTTKTQKQYNTLWDRLFNTGKDVTTYTYTIQTTAIGTKVSKVEYSTDGSKYTSGSSLSSEKELGNQLTIRVTDSNGNKHIYKYDGSSAIEQ